MNYYFDYSVFILKLYKKRATTIALFQTGNVLLSQAVARQVSSALRNLTSVFGMGTGVASVLLSPDFRASHFFILRISFKYYFDCTFKTEYFNYVNIFLTFDHWSSGRPISIGQLNTLLHLHLRPIYVVVFHESYLLRRKSFLVGGFALRCFQRLSLPYLATQLCPWQNNWCTSGTSIPVLSYEGQLHSNFQRPQRIGTELSHDVLNPARVPL